jgi:hypothetical protein
MKRWGRILVIIVVATCVALVLAGVGPLVVVRGWLTGEDFFAGRPTSAWRSWATKWFVWDRRAMRG